MALFVTIAQDQAFEATAQEASSATGLKLNPGNISRIELAATFRTGHPGRVTEAPIVQGDTLFLMTGFPHTLYALDLAKPRIPVKWRFQPEADSAARGHACCGKGGGGMALAGGRLYLNTLDGRTIALDAGNARVIWAARVADPSLGETLAAAPLPSGDAVFLGNAGDRFGVRGWIAALDAADGHMLWRHYSTGPDGEVGIGPEFRPVHGDDGAAERGVASWPPSAWQRGGGTVPGPILQDRATGLILHGTGYPAPWVPDQRQGDNRWTSGLFARDAGSGMARWFLPINTHDLYALGAAAPSLLLDREWEGRPRQLLVHPNGNGHVYVIDRGSGELLSAEAFAPVNATAGVDRRTATLIRNPDKAVRRGLMTRDICPARPGAVTGASAFLPETGLLYIPSRRLCMDMEARNANHIPGTGFTGANIRLRPAEGEAVRGALVGWDLAAARPAWTVPERFPLSGGVLALEGGLVLYGTVDGVLKALDGRTGAEIWRFQAASGIVSQPLAFTGPDGRPWLAVLAGSGDGPEAEIDRRDATAQSGLANVLRDLPHPADPSSILYLFRLP
ncbi:outer membrane protein assembly factor BamB family protein [Teichococcus oryzae]